MSAAVATTENLAPPVASRAAQNWSICAVAAAIIVVLIFPGDSQLNMDEIGLLVRATHANAAGEIATEGLKGSRGDQYGPFPTQMYQFLLLLTRDLRIVVFLRAAAFAGVIAMSLWSLGSTFKLGRAFIAIVLTAPWVWFYCRTLWDNTFCIPLGCLALAAYARWLSRPTAVSAVTWAAAVTLMPLIHLSAVAAPVGMFAHALATRWRQSWRHGFWIFLGVMIACGTSGPYLLGQARAFAGKFQAWHAASDQADEKGPIQLYRESLRPGWITVGSYAFRGAALLTADQKFYGLRTHPLLHTYEWISRVSRAAHLWLAAGVLLTIINCFRQPHGDLPQSLARLAMLTLLLHAGVLAWADVPGFEHYLVGVFAHMMLLCWVGVQAFWNHRWGRWFLVVAPATATVTASIMLICIIHHRDGGQNQYGHSVGNFMQIVEALRDQKLDVAYTDCGEMLARRRTLADLRWIDTGGATQQPGQVAPPPLVVLRRAFPGDAHLEVRSAEHSDGTFQIEAWPR